MSTRHLIGCHYARFFIGSKTRFIGRIPNGRRAYKLTRNVFLRIVVIIVFGKFDNSIFLRFASKTKINLSVSPFISGRTETDFRFANGSDSDLAAGYFNRFRTMLFNFHFVFAHFCREKTYIMFRSSVHNRY